MKPNPVALIIDSDKSSRRLLRLLLEPEHYRVIDAFSAAAGFTAIAAGKPDVIILDLALPDIPGLAALENLRAVTSIPVLILSTSKDESDIRERA